MESTAPHQARSFASLSPGVFRASTILFPDLASYLNRQTEFYDGYSYGQAGTPTYYELAHALAELEGGGKTVLVPTGMAAIALVNAAVLGAGDHVLLPEGAYDSSLEQVRNFFAKWGVTSSLYPASAGEGVVEYLRPETRLVWIESPGSWRFEVQHVASIAAACRARGVQVAMDNSWATPLGFKPLDHGVDYSVQSVTKYANGHSDLLMGSVTTREDSRYRHLRDAAESLGHCVSSDDCFLALRGLQTLAVRMERQSASALAVAQWLSHHPEVQRVYYPPLPSDPEHDRWKEQYSLGNGLLSLSLARGGMQPVERFVNALQSFRIGPGWGGTHSLVAARAPATDEEAWLVRLHIGLEPPATLIGDLDQALANLETEEAGGGTCPR